MTTGTIAPMAVSNVPVGELLRGWRERQRFSQLALAMAAEVSPRHISFLETGRARPSQEMLLRLAEQREVSFWARSPGKV